MCLNGFYRFTWSRRGPSGCVHPARGTEHDEAEGWLIEAGSGQQDPPIAVSKKPNWPIGHRLRDGMLPGFANHHDEPVVIVKGKAQKGASDQHAADQ